MTITLSGKQRKNADRVAGIELMIPWPDGLPRPRDMDENEEEDGGEVHWDAARGMLEPGLRDAGLRIIAVNVAMVRRPTTIPRPDAVELHLAVRITGFRWIDATGRPAPTVMWVAA